MRNRIGAGATAVILVCGMTAFYGCQPQPRNMGVHEGVSGEKYDASMADVQARASTVDPLNLAASADLDRKTEVEMVEEMGRNRNKYIESLKRLQQFYDRQGNQLKSKWAEAELKHIKEGPQRTYLVAAEIAGPDLRASKSILEADLLFREGMKYYQEGRGAFADKKLLYMAIDKFDTLITNYPESNMIDDAAFQIGQINHLYLKDYTTALLYYQRAWQWAGGQSTLPVRFQIARIYDDGLHNWPKAVQYYDQAINLEPSYTENATYARNRIKAINEEMSKR
jgi:TolA-binding protein